MTSIKRWIPLLVSLLIYNTTICQVSDNCITEDDEDGSRYRGNVSVTVSGKICQKWTSQSPNEHEYTPQNYPTEGLGDHSYCRNPDGDTSPWCFNGEGTDPDWENCDVPRCAVTVGTFTLVDSAGNVAKGEELGLLLYNGGTVCGFGFHYRFDVNAANAICHSMGYTGAKKWDSVERYEIQSSYEIAVDYVECTRGELGSCTIETSIGPFCDHSRDVFLSCHELCPAGTYLPANEKFCVLCKGNTISAEGASSCTPCEAGTAANQHRTECGTLTLVGSTGNVTQGELNLLLYNGGTVCKNGMIFDVHAANAVCHSMGYTGAKKWDSGERDDMNQSNYEIKLGEVQCTRGEWGSCTFKEPAGPGCTHSWDVFLSCHELCPAGTYLPANETFCVLCKGNTISAEGASSCTPCEAGTVAKQDRTECGEERWRDDVQKCGSTHPLPDGTAAECNPDGRDPCCSRTYGKCGHREQDCLCSQCVDYKIVKEIRQSGENCAVVNVAGFLKHVCYNVTSGQMSYKCVDSDVKYERFTKDYNSYMDLYYGLTSVSNVCEDDPHVYQACGFDTEISNEEVLCGGYICAERDDNDYRYIGCGENCRVENRHCSNSNDRTATEVCNDKCDSGAWNCVDEMECGGYRYGVKCNVPGWLPSPFHLPVSEVCNNHTYCDNGADERDCTVTNSTLHTCVHYSVHRGSGENKIVPILNYTRCSRFDTSLWSNTPYCQNYLDQTNCSDVARVGGSCLVNGSMTNISKYVVCGPDRKTTDDIELCDDGLENACISTSTNCYIHKHKMCNKVYDCPDESDEYDEICSVMTNRTCIRRFHPSESLAFPLRWVKDNITDCINGDDEIDGEWSFCGNKIDGTFRVEEGEHTSCKDVYLCPGFGKSFVELDLLCDGVDSCGMENRVCTIARDFPILNSTAVRNGTVLDICGSNEILANLPCGQQRLEKIPSYVEVFGAKRKEALIVPNSKVNCSELFGESYVYMSCMDLCREVNASCPLNDKPLLYDSCPGQFYERVYTLANNTYLTFATKSHDSYYYHDYYQCENRKCIEYKQLCDLIDNCGDNSDENNCVNHMVCKNTINNTKKHLISVEQKCDGIYDCFDLSDECNEECGKEILGHWVIKCLCWFMGILALTFNASTVVRGVYGLKNCQTEKMLINEALASVIGSGDFLIGVYLIVLSVYDSMAFGKNFCSHQAEWLTGTACSVLGVISTLGSQLSLFAMTLLSIIRVYGLIRSGLMKPTPVDKGAVIKAIISVTGIVAISLTIAILPLMPHLEDYFVQGMYYDAENKLFIGFPDKARHLKILQTYYNHTKVNQTNLTKTLTTDMTWKQIREKVDGMFSRQYGNLKRSAVHFYGNDGVCLFKYFVRTDDARRSRQKLDDIADISDHKGNMIVWLMLSINFTCFILITLSYVIINIIVRNSSKQSGSDQNPGRRKENRQTQNKITAIIVTDFLCWVPFIIISALHNLKPIDASTWYASFAMIVLPLNSVINPLLYDNKLREAILAKIKLVTSFIMNFITTRWQERGSGNSMEPLSETQEMRISRGIKTSAGHQILLREAADDIVEDPEN